MKKQFLKASVALALLAATQIASAGSVTLDPSGAWAGSFSWFDGVGQIDAIDGDASLTGWDITVGTGSVLSLAAAQDLFVAGDQFALTLDGVQQSWSSTGTFGGYFQGILVNLFLSAGTHILSFDVTALAPGYQSGDAFALFGPAAPAAVPLPAAALLFGSALFGAGALSRKRKDESQALAA